jgi:hypothetical protein
MDRSGRNQRGAKTPPPVSPPGTSKAGAISPSKLGVAFFTVFKNPFLCSTLRRFRFAAS